MAGQPNDLQQWLDALKKKSQAPSQASSQTRRPRETPAPVEDDCFTHSHRYDKESPQPMADPRNQKVYVAKRHDTTHAAEARREEQRQRKLAKMKAEMARVAEEEHEAKKRKAEKEAAALKKKAEAKRRKAAEQAKTVRKKAPPRSCLGLSGNIAHDLRNNPSALREAVVLLEILGTPLADRDPLERNI